MREVKRMFNGKERTYIEYTEEELEQMKKDQEELAKREELQNKEEAGEEK